MAGGRYDRAYADFAQNVPRMTSPFARRIQIFRNDPPAIFFAPRLVAMSVLYGMFGIYPRLRIIFPSLADDLAQNAEFIRWPDKVELKLGLTTPHVGKRGLLTSGVTLMKVLDERLVYFPFADIVFPPLIWTLTPIDTPPELGMDITRNLTNASSWVRSSQERVNVDLRSITKSLPFFNHPFLGADRDSWPEMHGESVIVHGMIL
ncbi:hypothetical protein ACQPW3_25460 [Actinosynnema sp. CA-248983]